jgi:hypothetical protein
VIRNRFYPQGVTQIDVWNHYQKVKSDILIETKNKDLMFFIMVKQNEPVVRRQVSNKLIRLTPMNYDQTITGRTVSIHSAMGLHEDIGIIDIDVNPNDTFKKVQIVTRDVYDFVMDKMPIVSSAQIRFTGKQSFHIKCTFNKKMRIDVIKFLLEKFLKESDLAKKYTVESKRRAGTPNLDMAPNKFKGNYITLNALSVWGLKCMEIPYQSLMRFDPRQARI